MTSRPQDGETRALLQQIGSRFRDERLRLKKSQAEMGLLIGVARLSVHQYENGLRAMRADHLAKAVIVGVDVVYVLLGRKQVEQTSVAAVPFFIDTNDKELSLTTEGNATHVAADALKHVQPHSVRGWTSMDSIASCNECLARRGGQLRTSDDVRAIFAANGASVSEWSRLHGFSNALVSRILNTPNHEAKRGQTHKIAIVLGLKDGVVIEDDEDLRQRYIKILGIERVRYSREALLEVGGAGHSRPKEDE